MRLCHLLFTIAYFSVASVVMSRFEKTKPMLSFSVRRSEFCGKIKKWNLKKQSQFSKG